MVVAEGVGQELITWTDDQNREWGEYVNMLFFDIGLKFTCNSPPWLLISVTVVVSKQLYFC